MNPVEFELHCITTDGPPTLTNWTKDNVTLTHNVTLSQAITDAGSATYLNTIRMIGYRIPGRYVFSVTNRRQNNSLMSTFSIQGM